MMNKLDSIILPSISAFNTLVISITQLIKQIKMTENRALGSNNLAIINVD